MNSPINDNFSNHHWVDAMSKKCSEGRPIEYSRAVGGAAGGVLAQVHHGGVRQVRPSGPRHGHGLF